MSAVESDRLKSAVVFYGSAPPDRLGQMYCPVRGLYEETGERIIACVPEVEAAMKQAGKRFEYKIYAVDSRPRPP
jgi:carboxymethylenebutenolidase